MKILSYIVEIVKSIMESLTVLSVAFILLAGMVYLIMSLVFGFDWFVNEPELKWMVLVCFILAVFFALWMNYQSRQDYNIIG